jgi:hypothetical protein
MLSRFPEPRKPPKPARKRPKTPRRCGLALAGSAAGRSRLGGGSARLANPQRRCAAGMFRRARPVGHRRKPKDAPCFKALKQCLEKWSHLTFNASFTVRNARFTVRNARFTLKNATPANESYPAGYTQTSVYPAGYDSRERASQRACSEFPPFFPRCGGCHVSAVPRRSNKQKRPLREPVCSEKFTTAESRVTS